MRCPRRRGSAISLLTRLCFRWLPMFVSVSKRISIAAVAGGLSLFAALSLLPGQSPEETAEKSAGCVSCHGTTEASSMHTTGTVQLGCIDCHGGNGDVRRPSDAGTYESAKHKAHPTSRDRSANPVRAYAEWVKEDKEYIRFVNPGDLRVVDETCGNCHAKEVRAVETS